MKFAREFKAALESGDYPEEWCHAAIPYPTLKKCLNKIRAEFLSMGLDADSLHQLLQAQVVSAQGNQIPLVKYKLDVSDSDIRTHFTILIDFEDGVLVDATLSPASRAFLQKQADLRRQSVAHSVAGAAAAATNGKVGQNAHADTEMADAPAPTATPIPDPIPAPIELPDPAIRPSGGVTPAGAAGIDPRDRVVELDDHYVDGDDDNDDGDGVYDYSNPSSSTPSPPSEHDNGDTSGDASHDPGSANTTPFTSPSLDGQKKLQRVEVSMRADSEFFQLIYRDMAELERIGQCEQAAITAEVVALGQEVQAVARPEQKRKLALFKPKSPPDSSHTKASKYASDLSPWRELFELYLDAQVFFSTRERDHGAARSSAQASRQLDWFQEEVRRRGLLQQFQLPASREAYQHFLLLNKRLYLNLRFRELNLKAQAKILKKFDKWTALGVSQTFPVALARRRHHDMLISSMARDVCARIAQDVVAVVPRLEDYTCPVCLSLAWLPVRLRCRHVFCVRCVIRMQRDAQKHCPLCRGEVVMEADLDNLDAELETFLKLYFRKETKEKQLANEMERGIELFGEDYKPVSCVVM